MGKWISIADARQESAVGPDREVRGWVRTRRDSKGGFSFVEVNDGSCFGNLQVVAPADLANYVEEVQKLTAGCSVVISGQLQPSPAKGQETELHASEIRVLGWADPETYPLQKKRHTFEKLREWAHLRPRTNTFGAVTRVRNQISQSIHQFFHEHGFYCLPHADHHGQRLRGCRRNVSRHLARSGAVGGQWWAGQLFVDFFDKPAFLTVSGQLEAETYATALGRVYTFGPTFRAENSNTSRHLAEFWMVEPEAAFFDLRDNMQLAEDFLKRLFGDCLNHCPEDMQFFDERIEKGKIEQLRSVIEKPFAHMTYTDGSRRADILWRDHSSIQSVGNRPAGRTRAIPDRKARRAVPLILTDYPSIDQTVLHAGQR